MKSFKRFQAYGLTAGMFLLACAPGDSGEDFAGSGGEFRADAVIIFDDALGAGVGNWSWAPHSFVRTPVRGGTHSIQTDQTGHQALSFHLEPSEAFEDYAGLELWIHGGSRGGQTPRIELRNDANDILLRTNLVDHVDGGAVARNAWRRVFVSFEGLKGSFTQIRIGSQGTALPTYYVDDIFLLPPDAAPPVPEPKPEPPPSASSGMIIGTNFGYMAEWFTEDPWIDGVPAQPWSRGLDVWNPVFLDDIEMYGIIRPMQWNAVNPLKDTGRGTPTSWSKRTLPDAAANFDNSIGTSKGPGVAFEWQIDLANRLGADLWLNVPITVDDQYFEELARLVQRELDPDRKVYVELANEVWNYVNERDYAAAQGKALGLRPLKGDATDHSAAMLWQARRSSQMWAAFERVFGSDSDRVINVLAGQSTNPWLTDNLHLGPLLHQKGFNPTTAKPEAYAIAPYFGGNGLPGGDPKVFDLLRKDIFEHRWNKPAEPGRLQNVVDQHAVVVGKYGLDLIAYEGGQHVEGNAYAPNHDERMHDLYEDYLAAVEPYFSVFVHFQNTWSNSDTRSFGTKDYTGQPDAECPKYRALAEYIERHGGK